MRRDILEVWVLLRKGGDDLTLNRYVDDALVFRLGGIWGSLHEAETGKPHGYFGAMMRTKALYLYLKKKWFNL